MDIEVKMVWWDWLEQPDWKKINAALAQFKNPVVVLVDDTGCDSIAAIITERPFTEEQAQAYYDNLLKEP